MNADQRWLLMHMGSWQIVQALSSPDGVSALMKSCWGSSSGHANTDRMAGAPQWLKKCGWDTQSGVITARSHGGPQVQIKATDINKYAASLPAEVKDELIACRNAGTANAVQGYRFCHCGDHSKSYPHEKDRICPPTEDQEREYRAEYWRIIDWQKTVLAKALGLDGSSHVDGDQLELFGAIA